MRAGRAGGIVGGVGLLAELNSIGFILWSLGAPYLDPLVEQVPAEDQSSRPPAALEPPR